MRRFGFWLVLLGVSPMQRRGGLHWGIWNGCVVPLSRSAWRPGPPLLLLARAGLAAGMLVGSVAEMRGALSHSRLILSAATAATGGGAAA
ncbi:hypothetical protein CcI49_28080 [Frankia sp. CcI49]|nr:hypothetical protein CcI49_28080 [Frankia sp. CcI49]